MICLASCNSFEWLIQLEKGQSIYHLDSFGNLWGGPKVANHFSSFAQREKNHSYLWITMNKSLKYFQGPVTLRWVPLSAHPSVFIASFLPLSFFPFLHNENIYNRLLLCERVYCDCSLAAEIIKRFFSLSVWFTWRKYSFSQCLCFVWTSDMRTSVGSGVSFISFKAASVQLSL